MSNSNQVNKSTQQTPIEQATNDITKAYVQRQSIKSVQKSLAKLSQAAANNKPPQ